MDDEEVITGEELLPEVFDDSEELRSKLPWHLRCASHTLNLIATTDIANANKESQEFADSHSEALGRCNWLWKVLRSPKINEAVKSYLGRALLWPVVTRLNSLYDSLKRIILLKDKILHPDINEIVQLRNPLRDSDFEYIEEYVMCLQPLADAIDILQGEGYCFCGYLLPTLLCLQRKI